MEFFQLMCTQITLQMMTNSYSVETFAHSNPNNNMQITNPKNNSPELSNPKEIREVLKSVGLPLHNKVYFASSCKLSISRKKTRNSILVCLNEQIILFSKSFGSSYSEILDLQNLNPPESDCLTVYLSTIKDDTKYGVS